MKTESNCKVTETDAEEADHVSQATPPETDKKAIAEYTEWEKSRPGKATR